jgi:alpha-L-fucosidase 2
MQNYGDYQSFGDLIIERETDGTEVSDYRRELDLDTATARVSFKQGGAGYRREYFVSYPDQVLVAHWYGTSAQKLRVRFTVPENRSAQVRVEGTRILVTGALKSNGLKYAAELRVIAECGSVDAVGDSLRIESECPITLVLAVRTNYQMRYPDYRAAAVDPATVAAKDAQPSNQDFYGQAAKRTPKRSSGDIPARGTDSRCGAPKMATDKLRAQYGTGNAAADRQLEQLYFQYGRYLLIASRVRDRCRQTCKACGTTRPRRHGMPTITSTSICR